MSDVPTPIAPSSIDCFTSNFMLSISAGVGSRLSSPITCIRTVVAPIKDATLQLTPFFSKKSRYSPNVFHSILNLISPCDSCCCFFNCSKGPCSSLHPLLPALHLAGYHSGFFRLQLMFQLPSSAY